MNTELRRTGYPAPRPSAWRTRMAGVLAVAWMLVMVTGSLAAAAPGAHSSTALRKASPPIRAAFYYPWFPETEQWATRYAPTLGRYDSDAPRVLSAHVSAARYAGLNAFISSYWGRTSRTARRLPLLLNAARAQGFHVTAYYELESNRTPPSFQVLRDDFAALAALSRHPAWLRVDGKPVLFVYNTGREASCAAVRRLVAANAGRFYLNLKVFGGYRSCATQPNGWHQYGPATAYDQQGTYSATVSPGFFKFNEKAPRLTRNIGRFKSDLRRQVASHARWQLVTTFNEWGEGTAVESARQWRSTSGRGAYLDALRAAYRGTG
jgi:Glycosyl hydrolase family 99